MFQGETFSDGYNWHHIFSLNSGTYNWKFKEILISNVQLSITIKTISTKR